uniref:Putative secreted protein n=1 Tax=Anopheles marajoara TaxID=58244 RepID=A0A2M4CEX0_9DIPT
MFVPDGRTFSFAVAICGCFATMTTTTTTNRKTRGITTGLQQMTSECPPHHHHHHHRHSHGNVPCLSSACMCV